MGLSGLLSCNSDENLMSDPMANGVQVPLTITVNRGEVTRTQLSEDKTSGALDDKWLEDEKLLVFNASGKKVGELIQKNGVNSASAVFSGSVTVSDDDNSFCLWYFGQPVKDANGNDTNPYVTCAEGIATFNLSNQSFNSAEALSVLDVLYHKVDIVVKGGVATVSENVTMQPVFAMARFSLSIPEDESGSLTIKDVSATNDNTTLTLLNPKYSLGTGEQIEAEVGSALQISVADVNTANDVYVALLPKAYVLDFTFNATDNTVYKSQLTSGTLKAGYYYCALPGVGETDLSGIKVEMTKEDGGSENLYPGYENEDPRNPLHKFAKFNLERKGERGSLENGFVDSDTENGALYQWGRNYGYMDKSGTYPGSSDPVSGDFTNYFDALGEYTWYDEWNNLSTGVSKNYYRVFDYFVYSTEVYIWTSGTGLKGYTDGRQYWCKIDNFNGYNEVKTLTDNLDKFFINFSGKTEDYWLDSFNDEGNNINGGSKWIERAAACGYENSNPCPEGWRLPTQADFTEICPQGMPSYNGDLSNLITMEAKPQLRETNSGIKYIIRWLNHDSYITIQAIVVENEFDENDISTITWDNNPLLVERKFPYTGNISSFEASDTRASNWLGTNTQLVIPYTLGTFNQVEKEEGDYYYYIWGLSSYYYPWTQFIPNENYGNALGGYWIGDSKMSFQFYDRSKAGNSGSSDFSIKTTGAQNAYAIRPVMDLENNK